MKTSIKILLTVILINLCFLYSAAAQRQPDYSGTWKLNTAESEFGIVPPFVISEEIEISQSADNLTIKGKGGTDIMYSIDGKVINQIFQDTISVVGSFKWSGDHLFLIKNQEYYTNNTKHLLLKKLTEKWRLSDNGKELVVDRTLTSLNNREKSYNIKAVYDKQ